MGGGGGSGECLSRASCKEDVAEERCFLTDKGKASLCQDVWAWPGPGAGGAREREGEPAVGRTGGNAAALLLISICSIPSGPDRHFSGRGEP